MYLAFLVQVVQPKEQLTTDDSYVTFVERAGFELAMSAKIKTRDEG